jgi:hypothetical protein
MQQSISFQQQQRSGRIKLLAILAVFAVPVLVAQLVLSQKLYQGGVTNLGKLITPYLNYSSFFDSNAVLPDFVAQQDTWHMLYLVPEQCTQACLQQIELLEASYELVGKDKPRVTALLALSSSSDEASLDAYRAAQSSETSLETIALPSFSPLNQGQVIVVDKLGQWVMSFDANDFDSEQALHKALLGDLKKLLKLSRVG